MYTASISPEAYVSELQGVTSIEDCEQRIGWLRDDVRGIEAGCESARLMSAAQRNGVQASRGLGEALCRLRAAERHLSRLRERETLRAAAAAALEDEAIDAYTCELQSDRRCFECRHSETHHEAGIIGTVHCIATPECSCTRFVAAEPLVIVETVIAPCAKCAARSEGAIAVDVGHL